MLALGLVLDLRAVGHPRGDGAAGAQVDREHAGGGVEASHRAGVLGAVADAVDGVAIAPR
jgi:hypothetical protein